MGVFFGWWGGGSKVKRTLLMEQYIFATNSSCNIPQCKVLVKSRTELSASE